MTDANGSTAGRHSLMVLAVIAAGAAIYWLRDILTPLALAIFLTVMIDGFVRVLRERAKMPKPYALPTALVLSVLLFGGSTYVIAERGAGFVSQLMGYGPKLNAVLAKAAGVIGLVGITVPPTVGQLLDQLDPAKYITPALQGLQGFAGNALFVLVYMGFLFASRQGFKRKLVSLFPHHGQRENAVHVFERIRNGVEQYLWIQTVTGLIIAFASWVAMALLRLDNAVFFAFLIFIICYIPVVGGAVAVLLPPIFALVQFPTFAPAIILVVALTLINFVVANIILPRMQGESLNLDPVVVLFALAFWTAIWGLPGAFLSTPLTVMAMIVLAQFPRSYWMAVLLSGNGDPESSGRRGVGQPADSPPETPAPAHVRAKKSAGSRKRDGRGVKPKSS